jgi:hypothetical protein
MGETLIEIAFYLSVVYDTYPVFLRMAHYAQTLEGMYQCDWETQQHFARCLAWLWPIGIVIYIPWAMGLYEK